ncbi:MAG TPA: hypothetical protein VFA07_19875 [Chthonomonadaceae bacterium]|nr:hypothetical protein [Chthonomonadaceae bacterium]
MTEADLEKILHDFNSRDNAIYEAAMQQARALSPEDLFRLANKEARNYRRQRRRAFWIYPWLAGSLIFFASVGDLFRSVPVWKAIVVIWFLLSWASYFLSIWAYYMPSKARRSLAAILEETQDLRFLGIIQNLIRAVTQDPTVRKSAFAAFRRLAPQLLDPHQKVVSVQEQNKALLMLLSSPYSDVDMTVSALKTLEQVGDESAIPVVQNLADLPPATWKMKRIREAAQECLPYLREHIREARQAQTLLRPSDSAASGTESLLRPTNTTGMETPQEQLLRATSHPDDQGSEEKTEAPIKGILPRKRQYTRDETGDSFRLGRRPDQ